MTDEDEARKKRKGQDEFLAARKSYVDAAQAKAYWAGEEQDARNEKKRTASAISNSRTDKLNFEKRLKDIQNIIRMLEGTAGGLFSTNVPGSIRGANVSLRTTNENYHRSIQLIGGGSADIEDAFRAKSVEEDRYSSSALNEYKNAARDLEEKIENLKRQIATLSGQMDALSQKISNCSAQQNAANWKMVTSSYDMARTKHFMD